MPFGLRNAPAVFQLLMEKVLDDHREYARTYIDDIIVFSKDWESHIHHIRKVLSALTSAGLTANPTKCEWGGRQMLYLGHMVGSGKLSVPWDRAEAMANFQRPVTKRGLRSFLGCVGYYRRFIPRIAELTSQLTHSTAKGAPSRLQWTKGMGRAFTLLCNSLCDVCVLYVPTPEDEFVLHTNASLLGLGGVLNIIREEKECPVAFFARQLRGAEKNYSATELEALAAVSAVTHFASYLYGWRFCLVTDHKALESLLSSKNLNSILYRLSMKLHAWDVEVVYWPGKFNDNADGLSRQEWGGYQGTCMGRKEKDRTEEQLDKAPDFNGSVQKQTEALMEMELNLKEGAQNS